MVCLSGVWAHGRVHGELHLLPDNIYLPDRMSVTVGRGAGDVDFYCRSCVDSEFS